jgi:hypothetical protein
LLDLEDLGALGNQHANLEESRVAVNTNAKSVKRYAWLSLLISGWGRATTLLSVLEVRHGSLDSTPAQDFVSSLIGLKDFAALWGNLKLLKNRVKSAACLSAPGIAPILGNQLSTGFEVKSFGELRQVVQSRQVDALKVFVN